MRQLYEFVKTTVLGGFFIVLPVALTIILLVFIVRKVKIIIAPVAALLPPDLFIREMVRSIIAMLIILVCCFIAGAVVRTALGSRFWTWFNRRLLEKIPGYSILQVLSRRLSDTEESSRFQPAVIQTQDEMKMFAFITEEHANGDFTVLVPEAPTPLVGVVYYVPARLVTKLDVTIGEAVACITKWGVGSDRLFSASVEKSGKNG